MVLIDPSIGRHSVVSRAGDLDGHRQAGCFQPPSNMAQVALRHADTRGKVCLRDPVRLQILGEGHAP